MLSIAHGVTGAFIASKIPNPFVAVPLILAIHYFQDLTPHWDVGTGLSKGLRTKTEAFWYELIDLLILAILLYWFWQLGNPDLAWREYLGALLALLPDFLSAPTTFFDIEPFFLKPINQLHEQFHFSIPQVWLGLLPQILLIIIIYFLR